MPRRRKSSALTARAVQGLQLPVFEHLDLLLHRLQPAAAEAQQVGAAPVAVEQLVQRQLAAFHLLHQAVEFGQRLFVAGGFLGGRRTWHFGR